MKYQLAACLRVVALLPVIATHLNAKDIWVATNGNNAMGDGSVGAPYATIQKGIEVALNGDHVVVKAGTYSGIGNRVITLMGKAIQVRSENGPYETTIDCGQQQAFRATSGESVTTVIDGFKIINGSVTSGADWGGDGIIRIYHDGGTESALTVRNCIFTGHTVTATYVTTTVGIIMKSQSGKKALIQNCLFYGNTINGGGWLSGLGSGGGGGVICFPATWQGAYNIVNCTIANNTLTGSGKIIPVETVSGSISNCIVWGNSAPNYPFSVDNNQATLVNGGSPVTYSLASGGVMTLGGAGILTQDPLFVNAASGDYSLAMGSPARNAGDPTSPPNPDGSRADIGYRASSVRTNEINLLSISFKALGSAPFSLPANASSGLAISYQVVAGGSVVSLSGNQVTLTGQKGAVTIRASQLGNQSWPAAVDRFLTFVVDDSPQWKSIFVGSGSPGYWSVGLREDGTIWTWGSNADANLGISSLVFRRRPMQMGVDSDWLKVAAPKLGNSFAAIKSDGRLFTWGTNPNGELGDGTTTTSRVPKLVNADNDWAQVSCGENHMIALKADGSLWGWGSNFSGQLGDGTTLNRLTPTRIGVAVDWTYISAGPGSSYALKSDGSLWAWGTNSGGRLGDGTTTTRTSPVRIGLQADWVSISGGNKHAMALKQDGSLWIWGTNTNGQVGDGTMNNALQPVQVMPGSIWQSFYAGRDNSMAVKNDGTLWAWGWNVRGQLGDGTTTDRLSPVQIGIDTDWKEAACAEHTLGIKQDGQLLSWGIDQDGELGNGSWWPQSISSILSDISSFSSGRDFIVTVLKDGSMWSAGTNTDGKLGLGLPITAVIRNPSRIGFDSNWTSVSAGHNHVVALKSDGSLWAWGRNMEGQLGDGTTISQMVPIRIGTATDWSRAYAGYNHTLALKADGSLWSWGSNSNGELGDGTQTPRSNPVQVGSEVDWSEISASSHSMARKNNGSLWAWGLNTSGQLGVGSNLPVLSPTQVGNESNWSKFSAGGAHSVSLRTDGSLWTWGSNTWGETTIGSRNTPGQVGSETNWVEAVAGSQFTMGLKSNGTLYTTGSGFNGRLAQGTGSLRDAYNSFSLMQVGGSTAYWKLPDGGIKFNCLLALTMNGDLWGSGPSNTGALNNIRFHPTPRHVFEDLLQQSVTVPSVVVPPSGGPVLLQGTASSGLPVKYRVSGPAVVNGNALTVTGFGPVTLVAWQDGDQVWDIAEPVIVPVVIAKSPQTITFDVTPEQLTTATVNLVATGGGSGNPVTFSVTDGPGVILGNSLSFSTSGMVSVTASQDGDDYFLEAPAVTRTFLVTKATAPLELNGLYQAFNGQPRSVTAASTPEGLQIELSYNGEESSPTSPGSYTVQATVSDLMYQGSASAELVIVSVSGGAGGVIASGGIETAEGNGTDFGSELLGTGVSVRPFTINNPGGGSLTLTGNPLVEIGGEHANDFQVTQPPQPVVMGQSGRAFEIRFSPAGPGVRNAWVRIASSSLSGGTYSFAISGFGRLAKLQPQTISFNPPPIASMSEGNLLLRAASSAGLPVAFRVVSGDLLQFSNAGMVRVEASQSGRDNVAPARPVVRSIRVQAASPSLTLGGLSHVYDGTPKSVTVFGAAGPVTVSYRVNGIDTATPPVLAGRYAVRVSDDLYSRVNTLVIEKAPLRVLPDHQRRFVGEANPGLTFTFEGWIGSDNAATTLLSPLSISTSARQTSPAGIYPITTKGGSAFNYQLIHVPGTLFIQGFNGSYEALLHDPTGGLPTGKLTLTIPAANRSFTGKLHLAEQTVPLSMKGEQIINLGDATSKLRSIMTRGTITYRLEANLSLFGEITVQLFRGEDVIGEASDGVALLVLGKDESVEYAGRYTAVFEPPQPAGAQVPVGVGWATGTVTRLGHLALRGKLPDGTAFTASLPAGQGMHPGYRIFAQPYNPKRTATFAAGRFALIPNPARPGTYYLPEAEITWTKAPRPLDSTYRTGFGPVTTMLGMDCWLVPTSVVPLSSLLAIPNSQVMVQHSDTGSAAGSVLPTRVVLGDNGRFQVMEPITAPLNVRKWQANLQRGTGRFSGSFELIDPTQKRSVPFSGVMRQTSGSDDLIGAGQFLLPPLRGGVTTEKQTGAVFFRRPVPGD
jgi:alpha-tubulin suppressor-like RCC1 family protein